MNLVPSDLPPFAGAARLSKPGFDILLAVSSARQAALPTVRMMRERTHGEAHAVRVGAVRDLLGDRRGDMQDAAARPARFFDLSPETQDLTETVNGPFTRGFQPMLSPAFLDPRMSVEPIPPVADIME